MGRRTVTEETKVKAVRAYIKNEEITIHDLQLCYGVSRDYLYDPKILGKVSEEEGLSVYVIKSLIEARKKENKQRVIDNWNPWPAEYVRK